MTLEIDKNDAFDYDTDKSEKYSVRDYQNMIKNEVINFWIYKNSE